MRRLVVFSDPGGAKPCLSQALNWNESDDVLICSDRKYAFFQIFGLPVVECEGVDAVKVISDFNTERLYTGTSYTSSIEFDFIHAAKAAGIHTTSFVDHYTGFDIRFSRGGKRVLPDEIHVIDNKAINYAKASGIRESRLRVTGNPYWTFLRNWKPRLNREDVLSQINLSPDTTRIILFAPDPLSSVGGAVKYGVDEAHILQLLLDSLADIDIRIRVLVKPHPNQRNKFLENKTFKSPSNVELKFIGGECEPILNDLIQNVNLVVGMFSNILGEAKCLGTKSLSILCGMRSHIETPLSPSIVVSESDHLTDVLRSCL